MIEFVMSLPLIMVVVGLTMYLGWSMMRKQHVVVADQYAVWKTIEDGQPNDGDLNRMFLNLKANRVNQDLNTGPDDAVNYWVGNVPGQAQILASELMYNHWLNPQNVGQQNHLSAEFNFPYGLAQIFSGDIEARTGREGRELYHGQAHQWSSLNNLYYRDLTDSLGSVSGPGQSFAQQISRMLTARW
jgi:hypothetical protein